MKPLALALLLLATTWSFGAAADDLVETARTAKAKRKKSTSKVITNEDVKKSKGKLLETPLRPLPDEPPQPTLAEKHAADRKIRAEHNQLLAAAKANVATLEKELAALEQRYYEEDDLDRRDGELVKQFNDVKTRLDTARKELEQLAGGSSQLSAKTP
ncbi:MAG TPA: hypothetical protein VEK57_11435 [Thermoanaerobaculia bacterium]|nr:hypothetical protein [Thermoanaerobaculia bacterium]